MSDPTFEELLRRARACDRCGKAHRPTPQDSTGRLVPLVPTWADPDDGHGYDRQSSEFGAVERWLLAQREAS